MEDNLKIWNKLGKTDPKHTKPFNRSGGFKGTAIKPMFSYMRMTEEFGPCGEGWGINEPSFQVVPAHEEILVYCTVSIWHGNENQKVFGVGGDKVLTKFSSGLKTDDEAFKKAFTDAVTNALKLIGVGADVHMGMFDDSKYVNDMSQHFSEEKDAPEDTDKWSASDRAIQAEVITKISQSASEEEIDSVLDEYGQAIGNLPATLAELVDEQMTNHRAFLKSGGKPEIKYHKFPSVDAAIQWMTKMKPVVDGFKSIKLMDSWEENNRAFIAGLDCLKAEKYKKDGKLPKERFTDALMAKRTELTAVDQTRVPIG